MRSILFSLFLASAAIAQPMGGGGAPTPPPPPLPTFVTVDPVTTWLWDSDAHDNWTDGFTFRTLSIKDLSTAPNIMYWITVDVSPDCAAPETGAWTTIYSNNFAANADGTKTWHNYFTAFSITTPLLPKCRYGYSYRITLRNGLVINTPTGEISTTGWVDSTYGSLFPPE